ncbi:hypothetical protein C8F04DRAFT_1399116 [Mycena alexandri]|uniref:Uncharacterized protein n=1 Tax=Mycena alexandri TaxID=1745969 RepID=A0AAD6SJL4_9AGAR|nr:hypothetical protein C8F04DRAFT_1399116 [Mycena alexandri]
MLDVSISKMRTSRPLRLFLLFCLCVVVVTGIANGSLNLIRRPVPSVAQRYPGTSPVWDLGPLGVVKMAIEDTVSYPLNGSGADLKWESMLPKGGGIVYVGQNKEPYMLSLYHQLKCLDVLRHFHIATVEGRASAFDGLAHHCLNYLRQMVLCRSDLRLESVENSDGANAVDMYGELTCVDWRQVYSRVEENQKSVEGGSSVISPP